LKCLLPLRGRHRATALAQPEAFNLAVLVSTGQGQVLGGASWGPSLPPGSPRPSPSRSPPPRLEAAGGVRGQGIADEGGGGIGGDGRRQRRGAGEGPREAAQVFVAERGGVVHAGVPVRAHLLVQQRVALLLPGRRGGAAPELQLPARVVRVRVGVRVREPAGGGRAAGRRWAGEAGRGQRRRRRRGRPPRVPRQVADGRRADAAVRGGRGGGAAARRDGGGPPAPGGGLQAPAPRPQPAQPYGAGGCGVESRGGTGSAGGGSACSSCEGDG
jgi:hypothetical protein